MSFHPNPLPALLLSLALAGCTAQASFSPRQQLRPPLPAGVELAFNHDTLQSYRSPTSGHRREGNDLEALIIDTIHRARTEVVVAVQELSLPGIAAALVERQRAGVGVRVVVENTYRQPWSLLHVSELDDHGRDRLEQLTALADRDRDGRLSSDERFRGDAMALLEAAGVPVHDDTSDGSRGSGLMHHQSIVICPYGFLADHSNHTLGQVPSADQGTAWVFYWNKGDMSEDPTIFSPPSSTNLRSIFLT